MQIRSIALLAISIPLSLYPANPGPPLAIYYSFDAPPSAAVVNELQREVDRIFTDAGVRVTWRAAELPRNGEDFPGIVFLRFRGGCLWDREHNSGGRHSDLAGKPLGQTDVSDGHVLPFGTVDCDEVRRFIGPILKQFPEEGANAGLGRAIARVSAHEIYHILTGSEDHASRGIARASYIRADLTGATFAFADTQTKWLRAWAAQPSGRPAEAVVEITTNSPQAPSAASDPGASAGR